MNWKTWMPLVLAIALGVFAAKLIRDVIAQRSSQPTQVANIKQIVVTKTSIAPGQEMRPDDLTLGGVAADAVPDGSFFKPEQLVGRVAQIQLGKGQPIVEGLLAPQGAGAGIAALVPNGMRAFTIQVDEFSGVGGMLVPNARVDVIASIQSPGGGEMVARTIVQNVKVQAVGQRLSSAPPPGDKKDAANGAPPPEQSHSVTLLVTPGEAEALELACTTGRPRLVLRSGRDTAIGASEGVSIGLLRGDKPLPPVAIATPTPTPTLIPPTTQPSNTDPFAYGPTTQPAGAVANAETRTISVIRGGQESTVTINVPAQRTAAQQKPASGDSSVDAGND